MANRLAALINYRIEIMETLFKILGKMKKTRKDLVFWSRRYRPRTSVPEIKFSIVDGELVHEHQLQVQKIDALIKEAQKSVIASSKIRALEGMSGQSFRWLLNNLVAISQSGEYLEIGVWKGSTAISALYGNDKKAVLVDNWSEFGGPKEQAMSILNKYVDGERFQLVDSSFSSFLDSPPRNEVSVFFYDGGHTYKEQKLAAQFIDKLNFRSLIFVVDDFNWDEVKEGTLAGLEVLKSKVISTWEIYPSKSDTLFKYGNWHNGYLVALISEP
jgi:hypothetical protein